MRPVGFALGMRPVLRDAQTRLGPPIAQQIQLFAHRDDLATVADASHLDIVIEAVDGAVAAADLRVNHSKAEIWTSDETCPPCPEAANLCNFSPQHDGTLLRTTVAADRWTQPTRTSNVPSPWALQSAHTIVPSDQRPSSVTPSHVPANC